MSISSLSSLDLEEPELVRRPRRLRRPRHFFVRQDPYEKYGNDEFKLRYRVTKNTFNELCLLLDNHLKPLTQRNRSISSRLQVLITLRFFATGSFQQVLADSIGIHKSTASRVIAKVCYQIASLKPHYIYMPRNEAQRHAIKMQFHTIRGFPKVIGAIDCTHIKIRSPGGENAELFRNRKGYFSLNVQMVCDANLKIRNIIARWPGSVHDSTIFNDSPLCADLAAGNYGTDIILGDNGYACKRYLLTPLLNPRTPGERAYNGAHKTTRNCIERCFGVLKRRFPCLSKGLDIKLQTSLHVIIACSVLHNICILQNDEFDNVEEQDDIIDEEPELQIQNNENTAVRTALINEVFNLN